MAWAVPLLPGANWMKEGWKRTLESLGRRAGLGALLKATPVRPSGHASCVALRGGQFTRKQTCPIGCLVEDGCASPGTELVPSCHQGLLHHLMAIENDSPLGP